MRFQKWIVTDAILSAAVVIVGVLAIARPASAQVSKGLNEFGGLIKYEKEEGIASLDVDVFYGRFITDKLEIGAGWGMYRSDSEDAAGAVSGLGSFHFGKPGSLTVPYLVARAGKHYGNAQGNPAFIGGGPGIKFFLGQHGAMNLAAVFRRDFEDGDYESNTAYSFSMGASIFFK